MTTEALIFMAAVWTVVAGNTLYCFYKLLTLGRKFE
jgi:hypothetical protein